jgi:hypothetical protein
MVINGLTLWEWIVHFVFLAAYVSFLWVPIVLTAYWIGRRRIGIRSIFLFLAFEGAAVAMSLYLYYRLQAEALQH